MNRNCRLERAVLPALIVALMAACAARSALGQVIVEGAPLVEGLGGPIGLGEPHDGLSPIDLTPIAPDGLTFYGQDFDAVYVNWIGTLTFGEPGTESHWGSRLPRGGRIAARPMIAVFENRASLGDFDLGEPGPAPTYVALEPPTEDGPGRLVATWFRVPSYAADEVFVPRYATWQAIIEPGAAPGDFEVEFRYVDCPWINHARRATVGFDAGAGARGPAWQWPGANTADTMLVCGLSNVREPGVFRYPFRAGEPGGCGVDAEPPAGPDRCDDGDHLGGDGCSPACYVEPDVDEDGRFEAPHPDAVDPLGVYDDCTDLGDPLCNDDPDGDGVWSLLDNCPHLPNAAQRDYDEDGLGDACDSDADGDGFHYPAHPDDPDAPIDNCPLLQNPASVREVRDGPRLQADTDGDGLGDACDDDDDGDGVLDCGLDGFCRPDDNGYDDDRDGRVDEYRECAFDRQRGDCERGDRDLFDNDEDGVVDELHERQWWYRAYPGPDEGEDNCRVHANPDQLDSDGDGYGDPCEPDWDGDGHHDWDDNCPWHANPDQADGNGDGDGDVCDPDRDDDHIANDRDNCPDDTNRDQRDQDGDGLGDACDDDADGDGEIDIRGCQAQPGLNPRGWPLALLALLLFALGFVRRAAQGDGSSGQ